MAKKQWVLIAVSAAYTLAVVYFAVVSHDTNGGHLVYATDDAYIHMAMAKNLVREGNLGITPYDSGLCSSSPLWTLLLAAVYLPAGVTEWPPLALNYFFGLLSLILVHYLAGSLSLPAVQRLVILIAFVLLIPLIPLVFTGMEHALHIVMVMLLVIFFLRCRAEETGTVGLNAWALSIVTALAVGVRYETLFLAAPLFLVLILSGRWRPAAMGGTGALAVVCVCGAVSLSHGGYFLPNPLMLKGKIPDFTTLRGIVRAVGYEGIDQLVSAPHLYAVILGLLAVYIWSLRGNSLGSLGHLPGVVVVAALLHCQFAGTRWFFRHEAYLMALGIVALGISLRPNMLPVLTGGKSARGLLRNAAAILLALFLLFPGLKAGIYALRHLVRATNNIYGQQYQMGLFLRDFYLTASVAANDIGAINFLSRIRCLDLYGLGTIEVVRAKRNHSYSTAVIRALAEERHTEIVMVYRHWYRGKESLPSEWIPVGEWHLESNLVCAGSTVTLFALESEAAEALADRLRLYEARLPGNVTWRDPATAD